MRNMNTNVTVLKVSPTGTVTGSIMPQFIIINLRGKIIFKIHQESQNFCHCMCCINFLTTFIPLSKSLLISPTKIIIFLSFALFSFSWLCLWLSCTFLQTSLFKWLWRILHCRAWTVKLVGIIQITCQTMWNTIMHSIWCTGTSILSCGHLFCASVKQSVIALNVSGIIT